MRTMQLDGVEADAHRARRGGDEGLAPRSMSAAVISRGTCQPGPNGRADGAMVSQGSSPGPSAPPPSHGRCADALRPAWASWTPNFAVP